jgi:hypothetical protein
VTSPTRRSTDRLGSARTSVTSWLHAYRAHRPQGMDPAALVVFGRD